MRINHNIASLNTYRQLNVNNTNTSKALEKLSSGLRINKAGDDAAGLAISEKMRGQIRGLTQAAANAQDGISLIQTAEGGLNEVHSILQRMRELATQAGNDTNTTSDRNEIQKELNQLTTEVDRIRDTTEFNTKKLLNGTFGTHAVSGTPANVEVVSALADTITEGSHTIAVTNAAVKASSVGGADIATATVNITAGTNDTLVLNGTTITFEAGGWTEDQIVNRINEFTADTGMVASLSGSNLQVTRTEFGAKTVTIAGNASATLFGAVTATVGEDAAITVNGVVATLDVNDNDGRLVTIKDGALKGMTINALGADASTSVITVNKDELTMQIGANEGQTFDMTFEDMGTKSLGISNLDVSTADKATAAITTINDAIESVSAERSKLGAYQNRLEHTINNLNTSSENIQSAESRIRDVDMAKEMMEFTKSNILSQAAQAMLAQANQQPQGVLQLLR